MLYIAPRWTDRDVIFFLIKTAFKSYYTRPLEFKAKKSFDEIRTFFVFVCMYVCSSDATRVCDARTLTLMVAILPFQSKSRD